MKENIRIAIQKSGRLNEESLKLLKSCGIAINNGKDQLKTSSSNFPIEVYYLRNGDIPQYLRDGVVDLAIIGENLIVEKGEDIPTLEPLGFSKCRVSIAVPTPVCVDCADASANELPPLEFVPLKLFSSVTRFFISDENALSSLTSPSITDCGAFARLPN